MSKPTAVVRQPLGCAVATLLLAALVGCAESPEIAQADWEATDSAGTALIQQRVNTTRELVLDEVWRVGSLDGDEATQFFTPRDAAFGPDGEVYILDSGNHLVKVYNEADGSFLRSFGSQGSGPGEFQQLAVRMDVGDDNIVVMDAGRRLHSFLPTGDFVETATLGQMLPAGSYPGLIRWSGEAWLLTVSKVFDPEAGRPIEGQPTVLQTFSFSDGVGEETGLAWDAAIEMQTVGAMGWGISPLYQQRPHTYLDASGRLYRVYGQDYGWEVFRPDGSLERRVTNLADRVPVSQADLDRYEQDRRDSCRDAPPQAECNRFIEEALPAQMSLEEPDFQPAVYQLDGSGEGDLLVLRADLGYDIVDGFQTKTYDYFAPDGRFRGRFTRGPGFRVIAVEPDRILAIERDDLDVESVVLYRLTEAGS